MTCGGPREKPLLLLLCFASQGDHIIYCHILLEQSSALTARKTVQLFQEHGTFQEPSHILLTLSRC